MDKSAFQQYDDLVNLIYATAMDVERWPDLLEVLEGYCSEEVFSEHGDQQGQSLQEHLKRAVKLLHQQTDLRNENTLITSIINRLPIGVIIVRANANITAMNNRAYELLQDHDPLCIDQSRLCAASRHETKKLHSLISKQAGNITEQQLTYGHIIHATKGGSPISLWVTSASSLHVGAPNDEPRIAIYLASRKLRLSVSAESLTAMYQLTASEIKLVQCLTNGSHNVRDAAQEADISYETARGYLKIIFQKTNTHGLSELLKLLLTSPAALVGESQHFRAATDEFKLAAPDICQLHASVRLYDGRKLAYAEYGDPNGTPVLYFHSLTGGRLECDHNHEILIHSKIRLIVPDRPSYGASSPKNNRRLIDWGDDIRELTDQLGVDEFSILTYGGGGPYGLACCHDMPEKIKSMHMVVPPGLQPDTESIKHCKLLPLHQTIMRMAICMPAVLAQAARILYKIFTRDIDQYWQRIYPRICENDRQQIEQHRNLLKTAFLDGSQQGSGTFSREVHLFISDWGFDVSDIETSIIIWHGNQDMHMPISVSHNLVRKLRNAQLIEVDNEGYYMIYKQWSNIIEKIAERLAPRK